MENKTLLHTSAIWNLKKQKHVKSTCYTTSGSHIKGQARFPETSHILKKIEDSGWFWENAQMHPVKH